MPTGAKTLRSSPSHSGQTVSASSENDCWISNWWSQVLHRYSYTGIGSLQGLALEVIEC